MITGIWYGANYGGSTTSILINVPGEATSAVTTLDGYKMVKKGRAGAALCIAAIGSFVAVTLSVLCLTFFAPPLAKAALAFGPPEYFVLALFGLIVLSSLSGQSSRKSFMMAVLGIVVATIGMDLFTGKPRFTMGIGSLFEGLEFVAVLMGVFGISEVIRVASTKGEERRTLIKFRFRELYPSSTELKRSIAPMFRGSLLGFLIGLFPGPSAVMASFASYGLERRLVNPPEGFGEGAVEGVAGPESANNAACGGDMVPLLALGLPFSPPSAVLISGLILHGVMPGPLLIEQNHEVFWGVVGSMYVGNVILLILNLPLVGVFASIARVRPVILMPLVITICIVGSFGINNNLFDVWVMIISGVVAGFFLERHGYEPAPIVLGLVLGKMMELSLRRSLVLFNGNWYGFLERPISAIFVLLIVLVILVPVFINLRKGRCGFSSKGISE
ncbi:MAG: tripartite tricarboxylate transporter permease [Bacillota bacterium]